MAPEDKGSSGTSKDEVAPGEVVTQHPAQTFLLLLHKFTTVNVHFDADVPDAVLPDGYKGAMCLAYGLNLPIPIPDLYVSRLGIRATLSFSGRFIKTYIPWSAVAMFTVNGDGNGGYVQHCGARFPVDDEASTGTDGPTGYGEVACILPPHGDDIDHVCMPVTSAANSHGLRSVGSEETPPDGLPSPPSGPPALRVVR